MAEFTIPATLLDLEQLDEHEIQAGADAASMGAPFPEASCCSRAHQYGWLAGQHALGNHVPEVAVLHHLIRLGAACEQRFTGQDGFHYH